MKFMPACFNEALHASGHRCGLIANRTRTHPFGSPAYADAELIAGMRAAFLCTEAGILRAVVEN